MNLGNLGSGVLAGEGVVTRCIGIEIVVPMPPEEELQLLELEELEEDDLEEDPDPVELEELQLLQEDLYPSVE